jgi:hypothetical protein
MRRETCVSVYRVPGRADHVPAIAGASVRQSGRGRGDDSSPSHTPFASIVFSKYPSELAKRLSVCVHGV